LLQLGTGLIIAFVIKKIMTAPVLTTSKPAFIDVFRQGSKRACLEIA